MPRPSPPCDDRIYIPPDGEAGKLIRSMDWSKTPLGPMEQWPQTLLTSLAIILESPFPQFICWGRELTTLYNDAYIELLGDKHPALGECLLEVWPEAREAIDSKIVKVFSGNSTLLQNAPFTLLRHGYPEETWFDFSFSPLRDLQGNVAGVFATVIETTKRVRELRKREERYRILFESIDEGFCILEMIFNAEQRPIDWRYVETNSLFEKQTGINDVLGRTILELVPNIEHFWLDTYGKVALTGESTRFEDHSKSMGRWWDIYAFRIGHPDERKVACLFRDITARKRAEQALRESENRFSKAFHSNPAPMAISDIESGRLIDINMKWLQIQGYTREEAIGRTTVELGIWVHPDQRLRMIRKLRAHGSLRETPLEFVTKSGEIRHALWSAEIIEYGGKSVMLSLIYDITARKRAEEKLSRQATTLNGINRILERTITCKTEEELGETCLSVAEELTESMFGFIGEIGNDGLLHDIAISNPGWEQCTMSDKSGHCRPPGNFRITGLYGSVLKSGTPLLTNTPRDHPDSIGVPEGHPPLSSFIGVPLIQGGKTVGILCVGNRRGGYRREDQETLEALAPAVIQAFSRKRAEEAVSERSREYQVLLESLPQVFVGKLDADLRFYYVSPGVQNIVGKPPSHFIGKRPSQTVFREKGLSGMAENTMLRVFETGELGVFEYSIELTDGLHHRRVQVYPDRKEGNRVLSIIFFSYDVSELVRAKEEVEKFAKKLEERVRLRTLELEQANKSKDEFLANISHEIRTPMAGVLGLTEILLHQELPADVDADLEMIRSSANSVLTLLNDLFDLSRISQGKFEFHPTQFDLPTMVDEAIGPFRYQAMVKDLEFTLSIDESVPGQILSDKDRLGQVIKNLVSNAIKFTDHGFVKVEITSQKLDAETHRLFVSVSDSGLGIPKSKQKDVFNAFMQLDSTYSKKFAGMGLGLAISKSLVENMGGEITLDSTEGEGATFSFFVVCAWASQKPVSASPELSLSDLPPMTVLLVEDNPVNRLFLRRALVTAGHKMVEAENGRHALEMLEDTHFDLVLMDIQMPEMDGIEATRQIRSGGHGRADIPIVALTAYAMKGDREKFLDNGMDGYVTKPVDFGELARTIAEVLSRPEVGHSQ
jgi:two-component system, sensor histidine kinase and response regulator